MEIYAGLDLSRKRLDFCALEADATLVSEGVCPPDADGLAGLRRRIGIGERVRVKAVIESMNGARFVHDRLEELGDFEVAIADAQKVKGIAPLAAKTDRIDARVLAELARIDLVPEIWLPDPEVRRERERSRFRLHLVKHRTQLKNRIHQSLVALGKPCPMSDLFGREGRELLDRLRLAEPWAANIRLCLQIIDGLDREISSAERELKALGATHRYCPLLETVPGIGPILAYAIAAEIGEIERFQSAKKLVGYTGLCPRVYQSGERDRRGSLAKNGPTWLRWALIEAAHAAARMPTHPYRSRYLRTRERLGAQRGAKVAAIEVSRRLATAIWHMLTREQPFSAPGAPTAALAA